MKRRSMLGLTALTAIAPSMVQSHTPYQQWKVYRLKHLLVGCHRADPETWELAKALVAHLDSTLPDARSRVARARNTGRLASLLGTGQLKTAIIDADAASRMARGLDEFKPYGSIDLRVLAATDRHWFIGAADIPNRHAWQIAHAMDSLDGFTLNMSASVPIHDGVSGFLAGTSLPDYTKKSE